MKAQLVLLFAIVALNVSAQTNSVHNWTLKTGAVFSGDYISSGTQMVVIKNSGTNCLLKISDLSTNDWLYFQECKAAQRQRQLDAEAAQLKTDGYLELSGKLIENFPEQTQGRQGWMDGEFNYLDANYCDPAMELGLTVEDVNGDYFRKCVVEKNLLGPNFMAGDNSDIKPNPLAIVASNLKRGDRVRLIGTVASPINTDYRRLTVERIEMIESAADAAAVKKIKDDLENGQ
jgi:hypothetical protein